MRNYLCGGVWTIAGIRECGYDLADDLCPCRRGRDTLTHEVWWCESSAKAREALFSRQEVEEARCALESFDATTVHRNGIAHLSVGKYMGVTPCPETRHPPLLLRA